MQTKTTNKRTQLSLPNHGLTMGRCNPHSERLSSHDHTKVAFGMGGASTLYSMAHRDVKEFGGEPFQVNKGLNCFRGVNPHKKSYFHPSDTAKRVVYQTDGSGRDGYIT